MSRRICAKVSKLCFNPNVPFAPSRLPFFYGWVIVVVGTIGVLFSLPGQTVGISVFTDWLIQELRLSRVQLSFAYLLGTAFSGILLPFGGQLFDRLGARKTVILTACLLGMTLFFLSQCDRLAAYLNALLGSLSGWGVAFGIIFWGFSWVRFLGQGMLTLTSRATIGKWFHYRRGLAIAISSTATAFCFALAPKILNQTVTALGWRLTWIVLGALLILVMGTIGWCFFRDNPEECGMVMDGGYRPSKAIPKNLDLIIRRDFTRLEALKTFSFWAFNLSLSFYALFATAYIFHITSIGVEWGLAETAEVFDLFVPMAVFSIATNALGIWLNDKIRIKYLLSVFCIANALAAVGMLTMPDLWGHISLISGMGMANGCFLNLSGIVWARFFGRRYLGAISGSAMSTITFASALGPFCFSLSQYYLGRYAPGILVSLFIALALALMSLWADNPQRKLEKP